jgi:putative tricarboxylic transport membrane protein
MRIEILDRLFALGLFFLGLYIAVSAPSYGYLSEGNPGPGFFPLWVGILIAGLSIVNFVRSVAGKEKLSNEISLPGLLKPALVTLVLVAFVFLAEVLGMILACAALVLAIGRIIHPRWDRVFTMKILATAVLFPVAASLAFGTYLGVPLPVGVLGF